MNDVQFGDLPPAANRKSSEDYKALHARLKSNPGVWARVATVTTQRDLNRWGSALRFRGLKFSQRKMEEGGWAVWAKYEAM